MKKSTMDDIDSLGKYYSRLVNEFGDDPRSTQQSDRKTQEARMGVLCEIGDLVNASILDFGCGTGYLATFLKNKYKFSGAYTGYDLTEDILSVARNSNPDGKFCIRDIFKVGAGGPFDYAIINGTFNNRISDNEEYLYSALTTLFSSVRIGLSFNLLSRYVDYFDDKLYYADPGRIFTFCKENLSSRVVLRHDYKVKENCMPYEFTIYVYKDPEVCRKLK